MTTQDLTNNRDRIIKKIQAQMSGDTSAKKMMVAPVMTKMLAMLPQFANEKATMANIDKLTIKATTSWIKYNYNPSATMTSSEVNAFDKKREDAARQSHSSFF
mgnify:CR=1 FL=1